MKKFLKLIYQFFLTIYIFESNPNYKKTNKKKLFFFFIKSLKEAKKKKSLKRYFERDKFKLDRFKNKSKFVGLINKSEIICSGWVYNGTKWNIEEVDNNIILNKKYLLYDFITEKNFRNKGYYKLLLRLIQNKFKSKKLLIYSLSHNSKSVRAIKKSGFSLIEVIKKY
jgi:hypothetical protein